MSLNKYRVTASYTVYCYATVEARSEDEAYEIADQMDGGDFDPETNEASSDWQIAKVVEIK
jgi:hypothetical protein